jgi:hypothetical protein
MSLFASDDKFLQHTNQGSFASCMIQHYHFLFLDSSDGDHMVRSCPALIIYAPIRGLVAMDRHVARPPFRTSSRITLQCNYLACSDPRVELRKSTL